MAKTCQARGCQSGKLSGCGTRVKVVDNGYGSGTRKYVRGGAGVTDPVLRMTTGADNSPTWTNYTPGVSERTSGTSKFMHAGIKNTDAQTDSSQAISATREYDAFGNVTASTGTHTGRFGYGGPYGYQEDEGGLKQLGHRLYDPVAGRFVTKDPIKDGRNWYAYCGNKPITRGDADGTIAFLLVPLIIVAGAVLCGDCGCSAQDAADAGQTGIEHGLQPEPAGSVAAGADAVSRVPYKDIDKDQQQSEDLINDPYDDKNENKLEYDQDGQGHRHIMKHKRKNVQPAPDILEN